MYQRTGLSDIFQHFFQHYELLSVGKTSIIYTVSMRLYFFTGLYLLYSRKHL